ncbi:CPBP family intramembrane metalloprotease [Staphylococcus pseudintermedius]|nr:CPBP family intramembrane metalloprotease [Staphylococcus pseudintermedius]
MPIGYKVKLDNKSFIIVLLSLIFLKSSGILISWVNNFNEPQNQKVLENIWSNNQESLHYYVIESVIVAPVIEEVLFRGVLFFAAYMLIKELKNMKKWKFSNKTNQYITATLFILVSSFLFSSMHLSQSFLMSLPYLFFGITLAIIFVITKNLLITITIHVLNNLLSFFNFFQSHAKQENILTQEYILLLSLLLISTIIFFFNKIKTKSHS